MNHLKPTLQHLLALVIGLAAAACGGGGSGGSIALDDLADELGAILCSDAVECGLYPTTQACMESFGFDIGQLQADVEAGLAEYDGTKARECLNASPISICSLGNGSNEESAACDETFTGSIAAGGSCFSDAVCAGDAYCDGVEADDCTAGTCMASEPDAALGENCAESFCAGDLQCNQQDVCEARAALGATCSGFNSCAFELICEPGPDQTPGTCIALAATGASCNPDIGSSFFGPCLSRNDYCDATDSVCKNRLSPGTSCAGETLGDACVGYASCVDGSCVADLLLGETCIDDGPPPGCIGGLRCVGGVCTADSPEPVCTL